MFNGRTKIYRNLLLVCLVVLHQFFLPYIVVAGLFGKHGFSFSPQDSKIHHIPPRLSILGSFDSIFRESRSFTTNV